MQRLIDDHEVPHLAVVVYKNLSAVFVLRRRITSVPYDSGSAPPYLPVASLLVPSCKECGRKAWPALGRNRLRHRRHPAPPCAALRRLRLPAPPAPSCATCAPTRHLRHPVPPCATCAICAFSCALPARRCPACASAPPVSLACVPFAPTASIALHVAHR